ncbi:MAG: OB-fold domain-containing protein, partial [Candidatus Promineifilaceae bacterium]
MIASISGVVRQAADDHLIVAVGGVGLRVFAPRTVLEEAAVGRNISLHTQLLVRETEFALYGFQNEDELALFVT